MMIEHKTDDHLKQMSPLVRGGLGRDLKDAVGREGFTLLSDDGVPFACFGHFPEEWGEELWLVTTVESSRFTRSFMRAAKMFLWMFHVEHPTLYATFANDYTEKMLAHLGFERDSDYELDGQFASRFRRDAPWAV